MGCTHSKVEDDEAVRRCKDRRKLMKQLVRRRVDLAAAHSAYLQALRNTGATLRQFAEVESALSQQPPVGFLVPPSPPPPPPPPAAYLAASSIPPAYSVTSSMPPSPRPPPPLPFSPITIRKREKRDGDLHGDDSMDDDDDTDSCSTPLPPPPPPGYHGG